MNVLLVLRSIPFVLKTNTDFFKLQSKFEERKSVKKFLMLILGSMSKRKKRIQFGNEKSTNIRTLFLFRSFTIKDFDK